MVQPEVFRQAMESHIVSNAHRIVAGQMPETAFRTGIFLSFSGQRSGRDADGA